MANPLFLLVIYTFVFGILGSSFPSFPIWVLTGLLVWNFFSTALLTGTGAITGNSFLVGKVSFPREVLPLSAVGAAVVHLFFSILLLVLVLGVTRFDVDWSYLWLSLPALLTLIVMAAAMAIFLSAINVYARDTMHLLEISLLAWFWLTPIVYPFELVTGKLAEKGMYEYLGLINPVTSLLIAIQRGVYGKASVVHSDGTVQQLLPDQSQLWYLRNIGIVLLVSLGLLALAIKIFDRAEGNFAEVM
jgi:ABC-2 type transport system permease protein